MDDEIEVTVRLKAPRRVVEQLVAAWLEDRQVSIAAGGKQPTHVDLTYVKEGSR